MSVPLPAAGGLENVDPEQIKTVNNFFQNESTILISNLFQFKDFLISYNKLSELCFNDCIGDFTSRTVKNQEVRKMLIVKN